MENFVVYNGGTTYDVMMLIVTMCLLAVSAMVSASEVSYFSLSRNDLAAVKARNNYSSECVVRLLSNADSLLSTILVINNLVNIGIVICSSMIIGNVFTFSSAGAEFLFTGVLVTFLLLLFGEILPKVFAQGAPVSVALFMSVPLVILRWLCTPLSYILVNTSGRIGELATRETDISIEDLADAIDITEKSSSGEQKMLSGIVNFVNTEVKEIMHSRMDITAVELTSSFAEVKKTIIESGFSRLPVYDDDLDNIKGTLYVKDLLPYIMSEDNFGWQKLIRKPYFVPMHKKINDLLEDFQSAKIHMAIVVDEYGATEGLVSLEDILEEVVGEISDESDGVETFYTRLNDRTYLFDGKTHIVDLERVLELDEDTFSDVQGRAETVAGLVLELKRDFPKKGDELTSHGLRFIVSSMEGRRIDKIKIIINE